MHHHVFLQNVSSQQIVDWKVFLDLSNYDQINFESEVQYSET